MPASSSSDRTMAQQLTELRLGTVGTGRIVHVILDAAAATPGISCAAVCSRDRDRGEALARACGAGSVYTDYGRMLDDPAVNCVYIASPNALHFPQTVAALRAGKHVICEKPFCITAAQARQAAALAEELGLFLVDAVPTTYLPNYPHLRAALDRIGPVRFTRFDYIHYSDRYDQLLAGRSPNVFSLEMGGGALMDLDLYNIYLHVALFGPPRSVRYRANIPAGRADTSGVAVLDYGDFTGVAAAAKDIHGVSEAIIAGTRGYIRLPGGANGISSVEVITADGTQSIDLQEGLDRRLWEVREVTRLMLAGDYAAIRHRLALGVQVIDVLDQARRSAGIRFPEDN